MKTPMDYIEEQIILVNHDKGTVTILNSVQDQLNAEFKAAQPKTPPASDYVRETVATKSNPPSSGTVIFTTHEDIQEESHERSAALLLNM